MQLINVLFPWQKTAHHSFSDENTIINNLIVLLLSGEMIY